VRLYKGGSRQFLAAYRSGTGRAASMSSIVILSI